MHEDGMRVNYLLPTKDDKEELIVHLFQYHIVLKMISVSIVLLAAFSLWLVFVDFPKDISYYNSKIIIAIVIYNTINYFILGPSR